MLIDSVMYGTNVQEDYFQEKVIVEKKLCCFWKTLFCFLPNIDNEKQKSQLR